MGRGASLCEFLMDYLKINDITSFRRNFQKKYQNIANNMFSGSHKHKIIFKIYKF